MAVVRPGNRSGPVPEANPTATLVQDLRAFEDALDDRQKQEYRSQSSKPDALDVFAFVSQLDRQSSDRAGRGVSTRLLNFLEAIQQFSGVVDTFVSSNPALAALLWGGVKFAILAASNVAFYFEKVSHFIMIIGTACPTFQQFGKLYPSDIGLQNALCDYYAVVVRLCTKIVEASQRSSLKQLFLPIISPFETEFSPFRDDLDRSIKIVHLQISLASKKIAYESAQLVKLEREANSSHRRRMSLFQKETKQMQDEAQDWRLQAAWRDQIRMRDEIKANLAHDDHIKAWKQSLKQRFHGTGTWFENDPHFCQWLVDPESSIIWCSGTLGTGKTVLTSSVVAYMHTRRKSSEITSYFFCQSETRSTLVGRNILGSIACQLLGSYIEGLGTKDLSKVSQSSRTFDLDDVVEFLLSNLEAKYTYFIILDGLDECENRELKQVSRALRLLCHRGGICVKVFCAGRPELEGQLFHTSKPSYQITLKGKEVDKDIETYVRMNLDQRLDDKELILGDPRLIVKIANVLQTGARGMFLWVRLLLDEICCKNSDKDIIATLDDLPTELTDLFSRILKRVTLRPNAKYATKVLQICVVCKRPLEVTELQEALSVEKGQQSLNKQGLPNDMTRVLDDCCGLTFVDEEEKTVHLVHDSVKQHLFRGDANFEAATFEESVLNENLGTLCMTYLNFNDFKRQLVKMEPRSAAGIEPAGIGLVTLQNQSRLGTQIAQHLLRRKFSGKDRNKQNIARQMRQAAGISGNLDLDSKTQVDQFTFLPYASRYWIYHLNELDDNDRPSWRLFCRCVESEEIMADRPWIQTKSKDGNIDKWSDVHTRWSVENFNFALFLYAQNKPEYEMSAETRTAALTHFAGQGKKGLAELLIVPGIYLQDDIDKALVAAAGSGHLDMVEMVLTTKADVNAAAAAADGGRTALQAAAEGGHLDVVERLLAANANVNAAADEYSGRTALQAAAGGGHLDVVERLLAANADVNAAADGYSGRTALQAAAEGGHLDVVERLLAANANVNAAATAKYGGRTALQAAAGGGHLNVVERLLAANANVNVAAAKYSGRTALEAAMVGGYASVVKRLKEAGAK